MAKIEPQAFEKIRKKIYIKDTEIAGMYDMEDTIGAGHFAKVKLAKHVFTGSKVAVKIIDKTKLDDVAKAHLHKEVNCMKLVQHPNVVKLYHVIDTQSKLYLILEYGDGGDLYDHIMAYQNKDKGMTEEKARHFFKQIVSAIDYCHNLHVVHRDLKPENVILFEKGTDGIGLAKLTDFGFSNIFVPEKKLDTSCGSLAYSAPEILLGDSYDPTAVDIWSLGVILYMMVCGRGPFNHASDSETLTNIIDCKYDVPETLSEECKSLIKLMLVPKPKNRASVKSILEHEWFFKGSAILEEVPHIPLISKVDLSVDVHLDILQAMPKGWSKEEIENSLKDDQYGNVTATYYLLAELILKNRLSASHQAPHGHMKIGPRHSSPLETRRSISTSDIPESKSRAISTVSTPESKSSTSVLNPPTNTNTPCTPIASDSSGTRTPTNVLSFDETDNSSSLPTTSDLTNELSHSDETLCDETQEDGAPAGEFVLKPLTNRLGRMTYPFPPRNKSQSSPSLLPINEPITEENESEAESPRNSPVITRKTQPRRQTFNSSCRLSPIHSRRSSYSSSDDDDSHIPWLDKKILSHSSSSPSNVSTPTNDKSSENNTNSTSSNTQTNNTSTKTHKATSLDNISAKMLSLLLEDLEQISTKTSSKVMLKNLVNNAYGRHLSDTNLTTYSMQLQLALAAEKIKNSPLSGNTYRHQSKSSSDTNLVKKFCKKKQHIIPSDIFKTKEMIFKYLKRTKGGSKTVSPISLSATIHEEDPISTNNESITKSFSDINIASSDSEIDTFPISPTLSAAVKKSSDTSSKYIPESPVNDVSQTNETPDVVKTLTVNPSATVIGAAINGTVGSVPGTSSVCCSLV